MRRGRTLLPRTKPCLRSLSGWRAAAGVGALLPAAPSKSQASRLAADTSPGPGQALPRSQALPECRISVRSRPGPPFLVHRAGHGYRGPAPQSTQKNIRPIKTATTAISQTARNVAPISPSSAISSRQAWDTESMCFESGRAIEGHFYSECGEPSKSHETYFSIKNQPLRSSLCQDAQKRRRWTRGGCQRAASSLRSQYCRSSTPYVVSAYTTIRFSVIMRMLASG